MRVTTIHYQTEELDINIYCLDPIKSIQLLLETPLRSPNGKAILSEGPAEWLNPRSSFFGKDLNELSSAINTLLLYFYLVEYDDFARFEIINKDNYESLQSLSKDHQLAKIMSASIYTPSNEVCVFSLTRILDKSLNLTSKEVSDTRTGLAPIRRIV